MEGKVIVGLNSLWGDLVSFYRDAKRDDDVTYTELTDLTVKMIGSRDNPKLKVKAAEAWGLLNFMVYMLSRHMRLFPDGNYILESGVALVRLLNIMKHGGMNLEPVELQDLPHLALLELSIISVCL